MEEEIDNLNKIKAELPDIPDKQISLTDPDPRSMSTSGRGKATVVYNVQSAVDTKHHIIIAHEVTNEGYDRTQLANMSKKAKEVLAVDELTAVADRGYYSGTEIKACEDAKIKTYLPKPQTSGHLKKGLFTKRDFIYKPENYEYECPAGEPAIYRYSKLRGCDLVSLRVNDVMHGGKIVQRTIVTQKKTKKPVHIDKSL